MIIVLTIAGFDPSGGAGVLADVKTFMALDCFGAAAITSLTSQNTVAVYGAYHQPPEVLRAQLEPVLADYDIAAVKVGMLPTPETIEVTAEVVARHRLRNLVVDPVMVSTSGYALSDAAAVAFLAERLLPLADVVTPNLREAAALAGHEVADLDGMRRAARRIHERCGRPAVLVKGGDLEGEAVDVLDDGRGQQLFRAPKIATRNTHGTGCTLSAAIAALLARGHSLPEAVARAKEYLAAALRAAPDIGRGAGPLNHRVS